MVTPVRPNMLGCALLLAAVLASGCERVRSLTKTLKQSGTAKPAVAAGYDPAQVTAIDASSYDAFIAQKNKLVIVDFYADWCPPCRLLGPVLEKTAAEHPAVVFVGRFNVDQARQFASDQRVSGIPDVRIFKDGREVDRFVGFPGEAAVVAKIATLAEGITPAAADPAKPAKPVEASVKPMPKGWMPPGMQKR